MKRAKSWSFRALPALSSAALALALIPGSGCRTPALLEPDPAETAETGEAAAVPLWVHQPLSWRKLETIESWLSGSGARRNPEYLPDAELALAEGRLHFARTEAAELTAPALEVRLAAAERGFQRVLAATDASSLQKSRAQSGLERTAALRGGAVSTAASAPAGLAIRPRTAWRAATPVAGLLTAHRGGWSRITVHHSATGTRELGGGSEREVAEELRHTQRVHMEDRGFGDIGYHFLIDPKGRIYEGRSLAYQGAHSYGQNNVDNIGVCLLGNFDVERPTPQALAVLERLVEALRERHRIRLDHVYGHDHFRTTQCPGRYLTAWLDRYTRTVATR